MKPTLCRKCKTEANRPQVERIKTVSHGKEFVEERVISKQYSCECGRYIYEGELAPEQISKQVRIIE